MKKIFVITSLLLKTLTLTAAADTTVVTLGDNKASVIIEAQSATNNGIYFISLHETEDNSVETARNFIQENGGALVRIHQNGERLISFSLQTTNYSFNPTKIFTTAGIRKTMRPQGTLPAEEVVKKFADTILQKMDSAKLIINLRSSKRAAALSLPDYKKNGNFKTNINQALNEDDFFLTTEEKIFNLLVTKKMNAVLQLATLSVDDGSLSVYCVQTKVPYVELKAGSKAQQTSMLDALKEIIAQYK